MTEEPSPKARRRAPESTGGQPNGAPPAQQKQEPPPKPWRAEGVPPDKQKGSPPPKRFPPGGWAPWILAIVVLITSFVSLKQSRTEESTTIPYTAFTDQLSRGNVKDIYAKGESIQGKLKTAQQVPGQSNVKKTYTSFTTLRPSFAKDNPLQEMNQQGVVVEAKPLNSSPTLLSNLLLSLVPMLLFIGLWIGALVWLQRRVGGGGGGGMLGSLRRTPKPVEPDKQRATFADVAGIDEVKEELSEVVDFLQNPAKYAKLGAKVPRGVLLSGAPGTGKTLLARAVAGEAGVPFYSAAASEFIEMVVGVGAARVRELFQEARKTAPSIIFIDEIDTIGRSRGGSSFGGNDEREQTLNQILSEMDGFTGSEGVIVIAATNRPDILDSALLRPGRFDRLITVSPPDRDGRVQILTVHTRGVPLDPDVDLVAIARQTPGMTGADLANLVNEAALLAVKRHRRTTSMAEMRDALSKVQLGTVRALVMPVEERRRTSFHESGHALLGMLFPGADPVRKITIVPHGRALGVTVSTPDSDRYAYDRDYLRGRIIGALGGMAAEEIVFGVVTTGAESDLEQVTKIARSMVGRWGMSERLGPLSLLPAEGADPMQQYTSQATLDRVDEESRRIVEDCYQEALSTLRTNRDKLDALATTLLEHETLDEAEAYAAAGVPRRPEQPED